MYNLAGQIVHKSLLISRLFRTCTHAPSFCGYVCVCALFIFNSV